MGNAPPPPAPPPPVGGGSNLGRLLGAGAAVTVLAGGKLCNSGAVVLAYHDVGDDPANKTDFYVSPSLFREHLRAARRWGLRFVDLAEIIDAFLAGRTLDGLAAIAFDDSLVGVHHHAMPILLELDLPATVFAVTDRLGETPAWWPGAARVMTEAELIEMAELGFRISSHTRTHVSLLEVRDRALVDELAGSRARLEDLLSAEVDLLAYPYGHYDPETRAVTEEAGYRAGYTFLNGRIVAGMDRYRLPRLTMSSRQGLPRLAYHLARPPSSWPETQLDAVGHRA